MKFVFNVVRKRVKVSRNVS